MYEFVKIKTYIDDDVVIEKVIDAIQDDILFRDWTSEQIQDYVTKQIRESGVTYEFECEVEIEMPEDED